MAVNKYSYTKVCSFLASAVVDTIMNEGVGLDNYDFEIINIYTKCEAQNWKVGGPNM